MTTGDYDQDEEMYVLHRSLRQTQDDLLESEKKIATLRFLLKIILGLSTVSLLCQIVALAANLLRQ